MDVLEERNEMFETPLIREAADGNSKNVLLLLEARADVDVQQDNNIGFTALHQAGTDCDFVLSFKAQLEVKLMVCDMQRTLGIRSVLFNCFGSELRWTHKMPSEERP